MKLTNLFMSQAFMARNLRCSYPAKNPNNLSPAARCSKFKSLDDDANLVRLVIATFCRNGTPYHRDGSSAITLLSKRLVTLAAHFTKCDLLFPLL